MYRYTIVVVNKNKKPKKNKIMDWKKLRDAGWMMLIVKQLNHYGKAWELIDKADYEEAQDNVSRVSVRAEINGTPSGIPSEELNIAKGIIQYGLGNYEEAKKLLDWSVSYSKKYGLENDELSPIDIRERESQLYFVYGKTLWFLGNQSEGESYIVDSYNTDKDNLKHLIFLVLIHAINGNMNSVDFYSKEVAKCYNSNNQYHRKNLHTYIHKMPAWEKHPKSFERFLRILKFHNIVDSHLLHSKLGITPQKASIEKSEKTQILNKIVENRIDEALDLVLVKSRDKPDIYNQAMILFNNYNKVKMEIRTGIISQ